MEEYDARGELTEIKKNNVSRDQIALQALLRVAALERVLINKGLIDEADLAANLKLLADDLVSVVKSSQEQGNGEG
jgi:hypothetical protein